ncbi:MAG: hypothetical protein P8Y60_16345 [Calditrichota bacterium]
MCILTWKRYFIICLVLGALFLDKHTFANEDFVNCEIQIHDTTINIGNPLAIEIIYRFKEPKISMETKEIATEIEHSASLYVDRKDGLSVVKDYPIQPFFMILQDKSGLEYKGSFVLWYDYMAKRIFFSQPGEYIIRIGNFRGKIFSNSVNIIVKSESKEMKKTLSLLSDVDDCLFLLHGLIASPEKRAEKIEHLKSVHNDSKGTLIANWSAARLGTELFKDLHNKTEQNNIDEIQSFLYTGIELPDAFPIREESLYDLVNIETMKGNKDRADSLRYELIKKYPNGEFTRKVNKRTNILAQQRNLQEINGQTTPHHNSLNVIIISGLSILTICVVILIRKMKGEKT